MRKILFVCLVILLTGNCFAFEIDKVKLDSFSIEISEKYDLDITVVKKFLSSVKGSKKVLDLVSRPAEKSKTWSEYKAILVSPQRVSIGCSFIKKHEKSLDRAHQKFGVPPAIIAAIIGVETSYGSVQGKHNSISTLATLAFYYPKSAKRKKFFKYQLEQLLLLALEQKMDLKNLQGSYAGALGIPQFMPNNYRQLTVDFDGDGRKDLFKSFEDSIGSVANYLSHHGWKRNSYIFEKVELHDSKALIKSEVNPAKLNTDKGELISYGVKFFRSVVPKIEAASILSFGDNTQIEYWVAYNNFYSIFRYNPRVKYALAVAILADEIKKNCD